MKTCVDQYCCWDNLYQGHVLGKSDIFVGTWSNSCSASYDGKKKVMKHKPPHRQCVRMKNDDNEFVIEKKIVIITIDKLC